MATEREPHLDPDDLATEFKMTKAHLAQMRYTGTGPPFIKLGGKAIRYRRSDVDAWLESNLRTSTHNGAA